MKFLAVSQSCTLALRGSARRWLLFAIVYVMLVATVGASAQTAITNDELTITLRIRNHLFIPAQLTAPANTRFRLLIINEDSTAEEFESATLNREKVIMGQSQAFIFLGPLASGEYDFFGEFNPRTAQGRLIVISP